MLAAGALLSVFSSGPKGRAWRLLADAMRDVASYAEGQRETVERTWTTRPRERRLICILAPNETREAAERDIAQKHRAMFAAHRARRRERSA